MIAAGVTVGPIGRAQRPVSLEAGENLLLEITIIVFCGL
jgi:hypothetical protein